MALRRADAKISTMHPERRHFVAGTALLGGSLALGHIGPVLAQATGATPAPTPAAMEAKAPPMPALGTHLPLPEVPLLDGGVFRPAQADGQVLVIYWWASDCPFCALQSPEIQKLWLRERGKGAQGLQLLTLSIDRKREDALTYLHKKGYTFPAGFVTPDDPACPAQAQGPAHHPGARARRQAAAGRTRPAVPGRRGTAGALEQLNQLASMGATLDGKLVVAISSRALFDFEEENKVFEHGHGPHKDRAYMKLQLDKLDAPAKPGVAFSMVKKLLAFNDAQAPARGGGHPLAQRPGLGHARVPLGPALRPAHRARQLSRAARRPGAT